MREISKQEAIDFLLPRHYSGRKPQITFAYGWFINDELSAVCTIGKPASNSLCKGVCGQENSKYVYELNRLCRIDELKEPLSKFVGYVLRELSKKDLIIVSYSDTDMNHHGYIYQATNFMYTGATKRRTDKYTEGNKHSRHYDNENQNGLRKIRSSKHRYVYFATKNKKLKQKWINSFNYKLENYPKGNNSNYRLGDYLKPKIVKNET